MYRDTVAVETVNEGVGLADLLSFTQLLDHFFGERAVIVNSGWFKRRSYGLKNKRIYPECPAHYNVAREWLLGLYNSAYVD